MLVFQNPALFDRNQCFAFAGRANAARGSDCRSAETGANLQNLSGTYPCEMIDEDEHIEMEHRVSFPNFVELAVDGLLSVLHERVHQLEDVMYLRIGPHDYGARTVRVVMPAHNNGIAAAGIRQ